jgi:hypothetical protein
MNHQFEFECLVKRPTISPTLCPAAHGETIIETRVVPALLAEMAVQPGRTATSMIVFAVPRLRRGVASR